MSSVRPPPTHTHFRISYFSPASTFFKVYNPKSYNILRFGAIISTFPTDFATLLCLPGNQFHVLGAEHEPVQALAGNLTLHVSSKSVIFVLVSQK